MFQKQINMRRMIYSLLPIYFVAFLVYSYRLLFLTLVVFIAGIISEFIFERKKGKKISEAIFVTNLLYVLSLPPNTPYWIAVVGIVFGVIFAKEVYGGFGRNIFNPAIVGRLFVYISFANIMTSSWTLKYSFIHDKMNVITGATPLTLLKNGGNVDVVDLFWGNRLGAMGEAYVLLIIVAAFYLIFTKTASYRIILSTLFSGFLFSGLYYIVGTENSIDPIKSILSGSFLFVTVFMATDPVSAPKNNNAKIIYGVMIGFFAMTIRTFSLFAEGTSFAILIGNIFSSYLDDIFKRKKVKA